MTPKLCEGNTLGIEENFHQTLGARWHVNEIGQGSVIHDPGALCMKIKPVAGDVYSDAQISDYLKSDFRWRPPLRLTVRARASSAEDSDELAGTAGFGFWNQPFMPGQRQFRLPQAVWFFFSSPPSDIRLAQGVPGSGWKAATINARRWSFAALAPTAPIGVLLMRVPALYNRLWSVGQRAIGVSERLLDGALLAQTHTYTIDWREDRVIFGVDHITVHEASVALHGALGFIAWIDNQYAIVTPQGRFGFGLVPVEREQSLILEYIAIETMKPDA